MISDVGRSEAIEELRHSSGLDLIDAKYWVNHCGEPVGQGLYTGSCPFCGMEIRTDIAKQCLHCKRDWHEKAGISPPLDN